MSTYHSLPDKGPSALDPVKAKEKRTQDAEKIRQDFIRSHHLPIEPTAGQEPSPDANEDEY